MKRLVREVALFGMVGTAGFLVDAAVLYLLRTTLGLLAARVPSFIAAVAITWWLNRRFTFQKRPSGLSKWEEFRRYLALMLVGGSVNYVVYAALLLAFGVFREYPVLGVAAGSIAGMGANLLGARLFLFR